MRGTLIRRTPSDPFRMDNFDRLFGDFFAPVRFGRANEELANTGFMPAVDIQETDEDYIVKAELAGLTKDDVDVTLENSVLTLSGQREFEGKSEENNYHRIERSYGSFSRSFTLPHEVDAEGVKASFQDGVLTVSVPKKEQAKPRKILIG